MARRLYSLFEKRDGRWVRVSEFALPKATAVQHWQSRLLDAFFANVHLELRPVKE